MTKSRLPAGLTLAFFVFHGFAQTPAKDTPEYLAREQAVEKEFLARHPLHLTGPAASFFDTAAKQETPEEQVTQRFVYSFAMTMQGQVEGAPAKDSLPKPSYWKQTLASLLQGLPFGNALGKVASQTQQAANALDNEKDKTALRNQQNFRAIIVGQGIATGEVFDAAAPAERVRLLMHALIPTYKEIDSSNPYSIFLSLSSGQIDADSEKADASDAAEATAKLPKQFAKAVAKAQRKAKSQSASTADDDPEMSDASKTSESSREAQKDIARFMVKQSLGKTSTEYTQYPTFNYEQRANAINHALQAFSQAGITISDNPTWPEFQNYLHLIDAHVERSSTAWTLVDNGGRDYYDTDLVEKEFGSAALKAFTAMPEGPEKDKTRIAAIVLMTQFQMVAAGLLIG